ncbi:hypothetical protein HPB51_000640 [Rhipicephalus microplus]|uniref:Receptor ligand binding region domain-containing protein n=1 Tax=Rhipicephalus microplus TaxID=6941 RepID=A0A9J6DEC3_RHIMP|nr:hypothetical protein HPB51_000640 [Rhipicephalus microplus]
MVCGLLEGGAIALVGPVGGGHASSLAASVCAALRVPQLETEEDAAEGAFTLDMAPSPRVLADACADLLERLGWLFVAYLYEDAEGLERLQELEREEDMSERKLLAFDLSEDDVWSELVQSGYRNIIIDVDENRIEDVMMQAGMRRPFVADQHEQEWGGDVVCLCAYDTFRGCKTQAVVDNAGRKVITMSTAELGNLPHEIRLVVSQPYMITHNIDVVDGLVNGAVGTLNFTSASTATTSSSTACGCSLKCPLSEHSRAHVPNEPY